MGEMKFWTPHPTRSLWNPECHNGSWIHCLLQSPSMTALFMGKNFSSGSSIRLPLTNSSTSTGRRSHFTSNASRNVTTILGSCLQRPWTKSCVRISSNSERTLTSLRTLTEYERRTIQKGELCRQSFGITTPMGIQFDFSTHRRTLNHYGDSMPAFRYKTAKVEILIKMYKLILNYFRNISELLWERTST